MHIILLACQQFNFLLCTCRNCFIPHEILLQIRSSVIIFMSPGVCVRWKLKERDFGPVMSACKVHYNEITRGNCERELSINKARNIRKGRTFQIRKTNTSRTITREERGENWLPIKNNSWGKTHMYVWRFLLRSKWRICPLGAAGQKSANAAASLSHIYKIFENHARGNEREMLSQPVRAIISGN
jgi:hypothetical protein